MPANAHTLGSRSRALSRGAVGDVIDGRSREGRFLRQAEQNLLDQLGGNPLFAQRTLVSRAAKLMLAAETLDNRMARGAALTQSEVAMLGTVNGALLDVLRELGLPEVNSKGRKS